MTDKITYDEALKIALDTLQGCDLSGDVYWGLVEAKANNCDSIENLINEAKSEQVAFDACIALYERYRSRNKWDSVKEEVPPESLNQFMEGMRDGRIKKPSKRGRKTETNTFRDLMILTAIDKLREANLKPSRNHEGGNFSACDVVADALASLGKPSETGVPQLSYDAVHKVWKNRKQVIERHCKP